MTESNSQKIQEIAISARNTGLALRSIGAVLVDQEMKATEGEECFTRPVVEGLSLAVELLASIVVDLGIRLEDLA